MLAAIASRDPAKGAAYAATHDIPKVHDSYEALLNDPTIDFIYVPLPNSLHATWTIRALEANKHVLCEKPLAPTHAEVERIAKAAAAAGRHVAEGFMYRHHPQWAALRTIIDDGTLGDLVSVDSWFTFPLDLSELTPGSAALGGGALLDVGCYCVHLSRMLTDAEPRTVSAMQRGDDVDRTMIGSMQMQSGVLARFECSIEADERRGARVTGTKGTAIVALPWLPEDEPAVIVVERNGAVVDRIVTVAADNHQLQVEAFVRAVDGVESWPIDDAVNNARAIDALFASARTATVVDFSA